MGILIENMEMPKGFVDVRIYEDGRVVSRSLLQFGERIATATPVLKDDAVERKRGK